jgi:F0F1-type ATP synthase membrane subunit a
MEHPVTWTGLLGIPERYHSIVLSFLVMSTILAVGLRARFAIANESAITPDGTLSARNVFELLVESISGLAKTVIGHHSERYVAILATFFVFILTANLLGSAGFSPGRATSTSPSGSASARSGLRLTGSEQGWAS